MDRWLAGMHQREPGWVNVLDAQLRPLGSATLSTDEIQQLTRLRGVDWPMSRRSITQPWLRLPFPEAPEQGMLVIELPQRLNPGRYLLFWQILTNGVIPGLFTLLLCVGLYRMLIVPLNQLREQPTPGVPTSCRPVWIRVPLGGMTSWASWPGRSIRWPSACRRAWPCNSRCCATFPMRCARP